MDDWTPEMDEAFNEIEKKSNLGKQILKEIKPKHEWVGLNDEERYELLSKADWAYDPESYAVLVEAKLKEKNTQ